MPFLPQLIGDYRRVQYLDSHTGGEPTRLILAGGPDLGEGPLAGRRPAYPHPAGGENAARKRRSATSSSPDAKASSPTTPA